MGKTLEQKAVEAASLHERLYERSQSRVRRPGVVHLRARTYEALHDRMRAELKLKKRAKK